MTKNSLAYDYRSLMRKTMRKMAEAWHFLAHVALLMQAHATKKSATPERRAVKLIIGFVAAITTDTFPFLFLCHRKTPLKRTPITGQKLFFFLPGIGVLFKGVLRWQRNRNGNVSVVIAATNPIMSLTALRSGVALFFVACACISSATWAKKCQASAMMFRIVLRL